jgi:hypothetical protein
MAPYLTSGVESFLLRALRPYILRTYVRAYARELPLDDDRLRYWQALHAVQGIVQVLIATGPESVAAGVRQDIDLPPKLLPELKRYATRYMN